MAVEVVVVEAAGLVIATLETQAVEVVALI
jgi:hypothetical protein